MTNTEVLDQPFSPTFKIFDHSQEAYNFLRPELTPLVLEAFPPEKIETDLTQDPLLNGLSENDEGDKVAYDSLEAAFTSPDTTIVLAESNGELAGFSLAMPVSKMKLHDQHGDDSNTAYVYLTARGEKFKGHRLATQMNKHMAQQLVSQGISYVQRDVMIDDGYYKQIKSDFGDSIISDRNHQEFRLNESRIVVDLQKYLRTLESR